MTVKVEQVSTAPDAALGSHDLAATFRDLADRWRRETATISSTDDLLNHPAYQSIMALGPSVVPLIHQELQTRPDRWFTALRILTGENPISPRDRGKLDRMA